MSTKLNCPSPQLLAEFLQGLGRREQAEQLERHLETCGACLLTLQGLHAEDALLGEACRRAWNAAPDDEPFRRLIEHCKALYASSVGALTAPPRGEWPLYPPEATPDTSHDHPDGPGAADGTDAVAGGVHDCLAPPQDADELGRLGQYRILGVLGRGGMGVVYRAQDPHLGRQIALKVMNSRAAASHEARQRFLREARAAAAIAHDNVVHINHVGEEAVVPYLVMPLLVGETLEARLRREGALPLAEALRVGREVACGLAAAHAHGLVHRDVKPSNVWLEEGTGRVKALDFGLAWSANEGPPVTGNATVMGTISYMAPEQAAGQPVDARTDLYSLGCVLYRMCTGRPPCPSPTPSPPSQPWRQPPRRPPHA